MCLTEYDEEETMKYLREEALEEGIEKGRAEGMEQGLEKGRVQTLLSLVQDGFLTRQQAIERSGMTEAAFDEVAAALLQR